MASVFSSQTSLNTRYIETSSAQINAATTVATARHIYTFDRGLRFSFLANYLDTEIGLLLGHPDVDTEADTTKRLLWVKIAANQVINYSFQSVPWYEFDPGAKLYVYRTGAAATTGKFVLSMW